MEKLHYFLYSEMEHMYCVTMKENPLEFLLYLCFQGTNQGDRPTSVHSRQVHSTTREGLPPSKSD